MLSVIILISKFRRPRHKVCKISARVFQGHLRYETPIFLGIQFDTDFMGRLLCRFSFAQYRSSDEINMLDQSGNLGLCILIFFFKSAMVCINFAHHHGSRLLPKAEILDDLVLLRN